MEQLTAFEFIAAADGPQLVRLKRKGVLLVQFGLIGWLGVDLHAIDRAVEFDAREDLTIEGAGLGHPYWNGEQPAWALCFDSDAEARRIAAIRAAALREINRASLSLQ